MPKFPLPLQAIIEQEQLQQVLWVTTANGDGDAVMQVPEHVLQADFQQRFDLVFIDASCFGQAKPTALALIAKARDLLASRVLVEWRPETHQEWVDADFLALAMRRRAVMEADGGTQVYYGYDLRTYKQVPDWLNPKYWANPQMWNKARW
ncbi:MAG TPA: DUF6231 family protein [Dongiaceae bacterium]|nr:DUF6231 family protein [Dongiaceae bacterium]